MGRRAARLGRMGRGIRRGAARLARSAARTARGLGARLRALPAAAWVVLAAAALAGVNTCVQVARKPTELLVAVTPSRAKPPEATWAEYGDLFRAHATALVRPPLLAALVQVESAGDPVASPAWRLRWSANPFRLYAPPSSAVGLLQMTDGTFEEARHLCIHAHEVAREGAWWDPRACWLNALYFRTVPGDAVEMTSARLHVAIASILGERGATDDEVARLAAVVHLCGPDRAAAFARRGFRPARREACGDQRLGPYLARVEAFRAEFARLDGAE
jgi:hypothetical protein